MTRSQERSHPFPRNVPPFPPPTRGTGTGNASNDTFSGTPHTPSKPRETTVIASRAMTVHDGPDLWRDARRDRAERDLPARRDLE